MVAQNGLPPNTAHIDDTTLILGAIGLGAVALFALNSGKKTQPTGTPVGTGGNLTVLPPHQGQGTVCPPGQFLNGNTGQCIVPIQAGNGGCPVNYTLNPQTGQCQQNGSLTTPTAVQLCAEIGYNYDSSQALCTAPPGAAGELLAPAYQGMCYDNQNNPYPCNLPAQYLPATSPVPAICQSGFFWDQQSYPGQPPIGCIANPQNTGPVGLCPPGMSPQVNPPGSCA